jgi:hypothetical protein
MRSLSTYVNEDTNQFGPGTDLVIALLAMLLVMTLVTSYLYKLEAAHSHELAGKYDEEKAKNARYERDKAAADAAARAAKAAEGGNFKLASASFPAADFLPNPVTRLVNPARTANTVREIVDEYQRSRAEFPYVFVIGHSNELDDPRAADRGRLARLQRNWDYASRRAVLIASLIQERLSPDERDRMVVTTTGEFDLRDPERPLSQENAWVEVVFGRAWKPPSRSRDR